MNLSRSRRLCLLLGCLLAQLATTSSDLNGQQRPAQRPHFSVQQAMDLWKAEATREARSVTGFEAVTSMLVRRRGYTDAHADSVVDALEHLASTDGDPDVRVSAAIWLGLAGNPEFVVRPIPSVLDRLEELFARSPDPGVRAVIIDAMRHQRERQRAVSFLQDVATSPDRGSAHQETEPRRAVSILSLIAPEGRAALQELHRNGTVRDPAARVHLQYLAERGFRLRQRE